MLFSKKLAVATVLVLVVLGVGIFFLVRRDTSPRDVQDAPAIINPRHHVIGASVEGRDIEAYTYEVDPTRTEESAHIVFVGGVHGGYEANSVLLAYEVVDYFTENLEVLPDNVSVTIIPSANPDGVYKVIGKEGRFSYLDVPNDETLLVPGRFNANGVDLNRNFDCKWKSEGVWRGNKVSTGSGAFSEPEARAIRDFLLGTRPDAVIFWHSKANAVYASECENGILPETLGIMNIYTRASGYIGVESFDAYEVNGDAEGWLASMGIPALTVELETRHGLDFEKNLAGVKALLSYYGSEVEN